MNRLSLTAFALGALLIVAGVSCLSLAAGLVVAGLVCVGAGVFSWQVGES